MTIRTSVIIEVAAPVTQANVNYDRFSPTTSVIRTFANQALLLVCLENSVLSVRC